MGATILYFKQLPVSFGLIPPNSSFFLLLDFGPIFFFMYLRGRMLSFIYLCACCPVFVRSFGTSFLCPTRGPTVSLNRVLRIFLFLFFATLLNVVSHGASDSRHSEVFHHSPVGVFQLAGLLEGDDTGQVLEDLLKRLQVHGQLLKAAEAETESGLKAD